MKNKIFVALDTDKINEALNIVNDIKDYIAGIKLGLDWATDYWNRFLQEDYTWIRETTILLES